MTFVKDQKKVPFFWVNDSEKSKDSLTKQSANGFERDSNGVFLNSYLTTL